MGGGDNFCFGKENFMKIQTNVKHTLKKEDLKQIGSPMDNIYGSNTLARNNSFILD